MFRSGLFLSGLFLSGLFLSGLFLSGLFLSGLFLSGLFRSGLFLSGLFLSGLFLSGLFLSGLFLSGYLACFYLAIWLVSTRLVLDNPHVADYPTRIKTSSDASSFFLPLSAGLHRADNQDAVRNKFAAVDLGATIRWIHDPCNPTPEGPAPLQTTGAVAAVKTG
jgi:hypothetical protein